MIAFVVAYLLMCAFVWSLCRTSALADARMLEGVAAREQEAEAVE